MKTAHLDYCSIGQVEYACKAWHYSHSVPAPIRCPVGVWEHGQFKGVILYGYGATPEIGRPFRLPQKQMCELTRVALRDHDTPVSRLISISLRLLKRACPDIRLVVSFADERQGHHGGIYQASGWLYLGATEQHAYRVNGKVVHPRRLYRLYGRGGQSIPWLRENIDPQAQRITSGRKHKYVHVLDEALRPMIEEQRQPYPQRCVGRIDGDAATVQVAQGGSNPTPTLWPTKRIQVYDD